MFSQCLGCFHWIAGWIGLFAFLSYVLPILAIAVLPVPDLKKKYGATWALVTGSSSGIGKSLARRLAQQGLNVVVCDSPDMTFVKGLLSLLRLENLGFMAVATQG